MLFVVSVALLLGSVSAQYYGDYHCDGGRDVMVHLFEWKWNDIAKECEEYLSNAGYCGVQVSPANEHRIVYDQDYPWWQRYQPVSYKMGSRSGSEAEFISMVERCNNVGVRIYVDAIINHMTGGGSGVGSDGSSWSGDQEEFPGVPFGPTDFHGRDVCHTGNMEIGDYNNADEVRYCRLVGLRDLRGSKDYVQEKIAEWMSRLVDWGVAGFRIDASKHMFPQHIQQTLNRVSNLNSRWFPANARPFIYMEVIDLGGEPITASEYTHIGRVTEFKYGWELAKVVRKIEGQRLAFLKDFGEGWGFMSGMSALPFVDNHDNQRGHGAGGEDILTFFDAHYYKIANAFELAWPYGYVRIMSSYNFVRENDGQGPPSHGGGSTKDAECFNGEWICEHRWRQISNMVGFHNAAVGTSVENWWDNEFHAIAFSRGNKAFIFINNEDRSIENTFTTGLPDGDYCDVISCDNNRPPCGNSSGGCKTITVNGGRAHISIPNGEDPIVAIHV